MGCTVLGGFPEHHAETQGADFVAGQSDVGQRMNHMAVTQLIGAQLHDAQGPHD
jgi:hypothetical protein